MMTNGDPEGQFFYPTCILFLAHHSIPHFLFQSKLTEVPEYAEIQCHSMTSLCHNIDVSLTTMSYEFQYNQ